MVFKGHLWYQTVYNDLRKVSITHLKRRKMNFHSLRWMSRNLLLSFRFGKAKRLLASSHLKNVIAESLLWDTDECKVAFNLILSVFLCIKFKCVDPCWPRNQPGQSSLCVGPKLLLLVAVGLSRPQKHIWLTEAGEAKTGGGQAR